MEKTATQVMIEKYEAERCARQLVLSCSRDGVIDPEKMVNTLTERLMVSREMYEMLNHFVECVENDSSEDFLYRFHEVKALLAKARGE
jgi:hypothetical protein